MKRILIIGGAVLALLAAAVFIVINLLVDLMYTVLDPRIRYS